MLVGWLQEPVDGLADRGGGLVHPRIVLALHLRRRGALACGRPGPPAASRTAAQLVAFGARRGPVGAAWRLAGVRGEGRGGTCVRARARLSARVLWCVCSCLRVRVFAFMWI